MCQEKHQVNRWLEYTKWIEVRKNLPSGSFHSSRTEGKQYRGDGVGRAGETLQATLGNLAVPLNDTETHDMTRHIF